MGVAPVKLGTEIELDGWPVVVQEKCDTNIGNWYCVTHNKGFANQLQKDLHIGGKSKNHVMAWLCATHGAEVP